MNSMGAMPKKINMSHFGINLGQTAEDSDMFTNIWLSSIGLRPGAGRDFYFLVILSFPKSNMLIYPTYIPQNVFIEI